jgi:hypothetical protein
MSLTDPWHSIKAKDVFANNTECKTGNNIEKGNRREGKEENRELCLECQIISIKALPKKMTLLSEVTRKKKLLKVRKCSDENPQKK